MGATFEGNGHGDEASRDTGRGQFSDLFDNVEDFDQTGRGNRQPRHSENSSKGESRPHGGQERRAG